MSITQERLMRIVDAAEHIAERHEELYKTLITLGDINDSGTFFEYQKRLPGLLRANAIDRDKLNLILREVAHFRVHFKRNARRAALLRLHRANPKDEREDSILKDYFNSIQTTEGMNAELELDMCPLCEVRALPTENWKHDENCPFWDSIEAGNAEVKRRSELKYGKPKGE